VLGGGSGVLGAEAIVLDSDCLEMHWPPDEHFSPDAHGGLHAETHRPRAQRKPALHSGTQEATVGAWAHAACVPPKTATRPAAAMYVLFRISG
jgi:hypothetical protein